MGRQRHVGSPVDYVVLRTMLLFSRVDVTLHGGGGTPGGCSVYGLTAAAQLIIIIIIIIINLFATNQNIHNNHRVYNGRSPEKLNVHQAGGP